jgi:hypothetical protein
MKALFFPRRQPAANGMVASATSAGKSFSGGGALSQSGVCRTPDHLPDLCIPDNLCAKSRRFDPCRNFAMGMPLAGLVRVPVSILEPIRTFMRQTPDDGLTGDVPALSRGRANTVPPGAQETIMLQPSEPAFADLESLRVVIARSPIMVRTLTLDARLADWARTREAPDVDTVILDWIASHVRGGRAVAALH